ncbi:MAG TPA: SMC-Scp complex subunit ScpB [Actinomycetes bacterium]|nr:SMC-Scp complex subunit ScpB [Actinomycetes bacterium]
MTQDRADGPEPPLQAALEAVLLVVDEPVSEVSLAQVVERPTDEVRTALTELATEYTADGRGFDLREVAGGWRLYTRSECAAVVERFVRGGQHARLTQAALETLAVVAYRQPVSRSRVSAVRGVNVDAVMRTLVARGLVEETGTEHETGAILYRTTGYFLERLGLNALDELPELAPYLPPLDLIESESVDREPARSGAADRGAAESDARDDPGADPESGPEASSDGFRPEASSDRSRPEPD